jgi:hypothetical protein
MGMMGNTYRILVLKPEGKRPLWRARRSWEDNIKIYVKDLYPVIFAGYMSMNLINFINSYHITKQRRIKSVNAFYVLRQFHNFKDSLHEEFFERTEIISQFSEGALPPTDVNFSPPVLLTV